MTTASSAICARCGAELPADAPQGVCPKCLLGLGFDSSSSSPDSRVTQTGPAGPRFTPPPPGELAAWFPTLDILELLGHGGMGAVYKARQKGLDRLVALKILPAEFGCDEAFMERFSREAKALARLDHPNIVRVYDFGRAGDLCYFLMEYVDGLNLRQLRNTGALAPREALALIPQICEALQYAHDEGVVHRDIKPENILVDQRGRVKIADFGLAKLLGGQSEHTLTGSHQAMGTIHYMAPEQLTGAGSVDHRADIYSLGVVFYELLTGNLPLGRFAPPSKKVKIDVRLDEVVMRALESEPEHRYQRASEVKTDVESICSSPEPRLSHPAPHLPMPRAYGYEYRSQRTLLGWPLVHVATGVDPITLKKRVAKGWIAIGDVAIGGVAIGGLAAGGLAIGGGAIGLLTLAGAGIGLLACLAGGAIGGAAIGGLAIGFIALGGCAVGVYAVGGATFGVYEEFFSTGIYQALPMVRIVYIVGLILFGVVLAGVLAAVAFARRRESVSADSLPYEATMAAPVPYDAKPPKIVESSRTSPSGCLVTILLVMLLGVPLTGIAVAALYFFIPITPSRVTQVAVTPPVTVEAEQWRDKLQRDFEAKRSQLAFHTWWEMTPDGPALYEDAIYAMHLTSTQVDQINAALRLTHHKFLELEQRHRTTQVNELGHQVTQIEPFPAEVESLEDELWQGLDAVLNLEQQRMARSRLMLHPLEEKPGISVHHLVAPGLFGYAKYGGRIETWRVGTWYSWKIHTRNHIHAGYAPELPPHYRQYWQDQPEPDAAQPGEPR